MLWYVIRSLQIFQEILFMNDRFLYLAVDLFSFLVPFAASFYPAFSFTKQWYRLLPALFITALFFIIWDIAFNAWGVWGFNDRYILGPRLQGLPLEEYLFFICIPYSSIFVHFIIYEYLGKDPLAKFEKYITPVLLLCSVIMSLLYHKNYYTASTFGFLSVFLIICLLLKTKLSGIYFSYLFVLVFFFITNSILTGAVTPEPVVWYNDAENIGKRVVTIPVEDVFYGFLLIAMNGVLYDKLKRKK